MPRYKLTIEYDGRPFVGWQIQQNGPTVQGALESAVSQFCGEVVFVQGAGRTDAGVHALGQVAHVDLDQDWEPDTVRDAVNAHLRPDPIAVIAAEKVPDTFDARFSATKRHYLYRIINRRADLTFERGRALRVAKLLNSGAMHAAAQRLVGTHDFTTFRHTDCQAKSPVKTLDRLDVRRAQGRHPRHGVGALVPAHAGALDGRRTDRGGRGALERRRRHPRALRRARAQPARRSRRPRGFIWSRSTTTKRAELDTALAEEDSC